MSENIGGISNKNCLACFTGITKIVNLKKIKDTNTYLHVVWLRATATVIFCTLKTKLAGTSV